MCTCEHTNTSLNYKQTNIRKIKLKLKILKIEKSIKNKADITELQTNTHVISIQINSFKGFPGNLVVKNPPAMQENGIINLIWEDPIEKEMAIYSRILTWEIP